VEKQALDMHTVCLDPDLAFDLTRPDWEDAIDAKTSANTPTVAAPELQDLELTLDQNETLLRRPSGASLKELESESESERWNGAWVAWGGT
jgi:hypothetical protein